MDTEEREELTDALVEIHEAAAGLLSLTAYTQPTEENDRTEPR